MSETKQTYADEVAPYPAEGDGAAALLRHHAASALGANAMAWEFHGPYFDATYDPENPADPDRFANAPKHLLLRYMAETWRCIYLHDICVLLEALIAADPAKADEVAERIWRMAHAGDSYGEIAWDWVEAAGIDAQRVHDEAKAWAMERIIKDGDTPRIMPGAPS